MTLDGTAGAFFCERALVEAALEADVLIEVEDGRITSLRSGASPVDGAVRLFGVTLPGFANAHSHAFHRALRGHDASGADSFWSWREQMYALAERLDPDRYLALAQATFAEMVLAGYTAVGEFHYLHHDRDGRRYSDANAMGEALIEAARLAGIRITLLDACYLEAAPGEAVAGVQRRFSDGAVATWAERTSALRAGPGVRIGAAIHSVRAVPPAAIAEVAAVAERRDIPLHVHLSEQPAENEACRRAYGCSPTALLERNGALGAAVTAVHATHVSDDDVAALGGVRTSICMCPTTERHLADGIGRAAALAAAGSPIALGSDGHTTIDPFAEMRALEDGERLATLRRGAFTPEALLESAGAAGFASLGWPECGRIAVGAAADLVVLDTSAPRFSTGAPHVPAAVLCAAANGADVTDVVVGGRQVVANRAHVRLDVTAALDDALAALWCP